MSIIIREANPYQNRPDAVATPEQASTVKRLGLTVLPHRFISTPRWGERIQSCAIALGPNGEELVVFPDGGIADAELGDTPYPWCYGNPTRLACKLNGYCRRNPSCGD